MCNYHFIEKWSRAHRFHQQNWTNKILPCKANLRQVSIVTHRCLVKNKETHGQSFTFSTMLLEQKATRMLLHTMPWSRQFKKPTKSILSPNIVAYILHPFFLLHSHHFFFCYITVYRTFLLTRCLLFKLHTRPRTSELSERKTRKLTPLWIRLKLHAGY